MDIPDFERPFAAFSRPGVTVTQKSRALMLLISYIESETAKLSPRAAALLKLAREALQDDVQNSRTFN